ncbi:hypothetical protein [Streptomyces nigrescens]|uniref:hypothetical protein n=1 Tax=Streptomyces nigrescens TaxID=1920 RepID=UPI0013569F07|nr:hypothetical protein [Streptomyces libani]
MSGLTPKFLDGREVRPLASVNSWIFPYAKATAPRILFRKKTKVNAGKVDQ